MLYLGSREIAEVMGTSVRSAEMLLNRFEAEGKTIRVGNRKKVNLHLLCAYLCRQDGSDPKILAEQIRKITKGT